jgi:hypothetical protein
MQKLLVESLVSGTAGALAMMPFGFLFRLVDMRVGHYGPKFAALYLTSPGPAALFVQHLVLGWLSAVPLVWLNTTGQSLVRRVMVGALYGVAYYVVVNSLALPVYFGDELPWRLGAAVVVPSLVVHIAFGVAVAAALHAWRSRHALANR